MTWEAIKEDYISIGKAEGKTEANAKTVKNLMKNIGLDVTKAMQALEIPAEEQKTIRGLVLEPEEQATTATT